MPVTFLVLRNDEYAILKWFADLEQVEGAPGLDLPALDTAASPPATGSPRAGSSGRDELREALGEAIAAERPELVEVAVAPGMALF